MRYSNYMFSKGSIVFIKASPSSDKAYLNGRPLIVVSNPTHIMNTLLVCTTGTQNKPGIEISLYNHYSKSYCGDNVISKIYPYNILTIYVDQIESSLGQLDPFIMKELDNAIDFHLGRTDVVPGYLKNIEDELCGVTYKEIEDRYYTQEAIHQSTLPSFPKFAASRYTREVAATSMPTEDKVDDATENTTSKNDNKSIVLEWANKSVSVSGDIIKKYCHNEAEVGKLLDEESVAIIVSRAAPISTISEKFNISKQHASFLRITLTNISIQMATFQLTKPDARSKYPPDYIIIGMILLNAFAPDKIPNGAIKMYRDRIDSVVSKYGIDTSNRKIWKAVENFNSL